MIIKKTSSNGVSTKKSWLWIPTLFFAEGLPYFIVLTVSVFLFKRFGISTSDIIAYTGLFYLPWVLKPFWSPLVDIVKTKRTWICYMQLLMAIGLGGIALVMMLPNFFEYSIFFFWLIAFASATHDISVDGFYILSLNKKQQAGFIGARTIFYQVALLIGQSLIILFAENLEPYVSVGAGEFKIVATPDKYISETAKLESFNYKPITGPLRIIAGKKSIEIGTDPKMAEEIASFREIIHNFNLMNNFSNDESSILSPSEMNNKKVGNVGLINLHLSKKPDKNEEYNVSVEQVDGSEKIKIIEGGTLKFNSKNWNKPALVLAQVDSSIFQRTEAVFRIQSNQVQFAWIIPFGICSGIFLLLFIFHKRILPYPYEDKSVAQKYNLSFWKNYVRIIVRFFEKKKVVAIILFLVLYLFVETQISKTSAMFLADKRIFGGLGLPGDIVKYLLTYYNIISFGAGILVGGLILNKGKLRAWLLPMAVVMNIPSLLYAYLAFAQPTDYIIIYACVLCQQLCFGFGTAGYILYMINVAEGEFKTSHYSIATGFMTLGIIISGMLSIPISKQIGYKYFYFSLILFVIPVISIIKYLPFYENTTDTNSTNIE